MNAVNFVSPRSWLTCSHWFLAFGLLVGHWWHSGRSHAVASRLAFGLSRVYEPVLFLRPVDWSKQDLLLVTRVGSALCLTPMAFEEGISAPDTILLP